VLGSISQYLASAAGGSREWRGSPRRELGHGPGDADDTFLPASQHSEDTVSGYIRFRKLTQRSHSACIWSDVMSSNTISRPLSGDHLHRLKKRWQRGLAIECTLIVLLVGFSAFQFLSVV
jgi:hypothetical protein